MWYVNIDSELCQYHHKQQLKRKITSNNMADRISSCNESYHKIKEMINQTYCGCQWTLLIVSIVNLIYTYSLHSLWKTIKRNKEKKEKSSVYILKNMIHIIIYRRQALMHHETYQVSASSTAPILHIMKRKITSNNMTDCISSHNESYHKIKKMMNQTYCGCQWTLLIVYNCQLDLHLFPPFPNKNNKMEQRQKKKRVVFIFWRIWYTK